LSNKVIVLCPSFNGTNSDRVRGSFFHLWLNSSTIVMQRFTLNVDQQSALSRMCDWFRGERVDDIFLIHGVFGSGKVGLTSPLVVSSSHYPHKM
jgi:hypothetical protein